MRDDVRGLFDHDPNVVLGRKSAGTLTLSEDNKGLKYTIRLNREDLVAMSVAARIERRDITGSSFWFDIDNPDDEEWQFDDHKKLPLRTLKRLRLVDVSPVSFPAYTDTTVSARDESVAERERLHTKIRLARLRANIKSEMAWKSIPKVHDEQLRRARSVSPEPTRRTESNITATDLFVERMWL